MPLNLFSRSKKTGGSASAGSPGPVTVVSGLPRSGTSMMMKMVAAGGLEIVTDNLRTADEDNPKGYYEFERVKKLKEGDTAWVKDAQGKAVKVISALLEHLPAAYQYRVIFMQRSMPEILASQREMLIRRGEAPDKVSDEQMALLYEKHLAKVYAWLEEQPNFEVLYVDYRDVLAEPEKHAAEINRFLGGGLDEAAMRQVVDKNLYRQRKP